MSVNVALIQCQFGHDPRENQQKIAHYLAEAKQQHANLVLPPELPENHYFCKTQNEDYFKNAFAIDEHPRLKEVQKICKQLGLIVPWSFFEKSGPHFYNSVAIINTRGNIVGVYRKSHIPDGPGYQEKFYFRPGNTGFTVFKTEVGALGVGICWDQWFPETARILVLKGADLLLYPTAIGSEPAAPWLNTKDPWRRVMIGHAVANMIPVACSNRVGIENNQSFYGHSFICNEFGDMTLEFTNEEGVKSAQIDTEKAASNRAAFGFFRDRRTDLYGELLR